MALKNEIEAFKKTLHQNSPPEHWSPCLKSLWYDANANWNTAHSLVDGSKEPMADAIHAYLHRKEGDEWNAGYWYRIAKRPFFEGSFEQEFQQLLEECLA